MIKMLRQHRVKVMALTMALAAVAIVGSATAPAALASVCYCYGPSFGGFPPGCYYLGESVWVGAGQSCRLECEADHQMHIANY